MTEPSGIAVFSPKIRDQSIVRKFVSQGGRGYIAVNLRDGTSSIDADPNTLALKVWYLNPLEQFPTSDDPRGSVIVDVDADAIQREELGHYFYNIGPEHTANRGVLTAQWSYSVGGNDFTFYDHLQILEQMPFYDSLQDSEKYVVERVSWMFGDLFDSTEGGPHLIEPFQTHFNYERVAQLSSLAAERINLTGYPATNWGVGPGTQTVPLNFNGLLVFGTYLEVLRHLMRSYVEIPDFVGMNVTYTSRKDYLQRWESIYQLEAPQFEAMVKRAKRSLLQLGRGSILVGGGIYGPSANLFIRSMYSSQVRSFRFYPSAWAVAFGSPR